MRNIALLALCVSTLTAGCGGGGGDAIAQEAGASVPVLRTASGRVVGVLMDIAGSGGDQLRVIQTINNQTTVIVIGGAGANGERGIQGESLYYASANCSGTPYSMVSGLVTNKLTARHKGRWYVADKDAAQFEFGYSSQSINDDCLVTAGAGVGAQAIELSDAQSAAIDGYTGPFEASLASASVVPGL